MSLTGRRKWFVLLTFKHTYLLIHFLFHSFIQNWGKHVVTQDHDGNGSSTKRGSADTGTGARMMWWVLQGKKYEVVFPGTFQIALYLPFGWVNKEMIESLVEGLVISHVSQKRHDHTGATLGLLQGYILFQSIRSIRILCHFQTVKPLSSSKLHLEVT